MTIKKVLLLGSGALKIGQAGEFDYSGSQALKALKEEGVYTVLINPNIATIQTSQGLADKIYFLPVNTYFVEEVIKKEKPEGVLLSFGGQTALNCGLELSKQGIFKKYNVSVLGTPVRSIEITEDRKLFAQTLDSIEVKTPKGDFATTVPQALKIAQKIGYPLMIRSGFALGGLGSSVVSNDEQLKQAALVALKNAPQIAIEEYLKHWKEIEYEVVRDNNGNKITVCNMENFDPLGVHTGESIVVAPSQTLNNYQYHFLRRLSLKVIEHLGIVGECNIQFGLDPKSNDYRVIEVNARLSRSSALASKATGYPLAYIACKIALGKNLPELKNNVTGSTSAFFEPALDYLVLKFPRWDLQKFDNTEKKIGSEMKSVGEVMAIGRSFPEVLQKAVRMLETGQDGLLGFEDRVRGKQPLDEILTPTTERLFYVARLLAKGSSVDSIYKITGIDKWFLYQLKEIVDFEIDLKDKKLKKTKEVFRKAKKLGFSDSVLAKYFSQSHDQTRKLRKQFNVLPVVKHIDTLAAEYPAKTNYLYLTYHGDESEIDALKSENRSKNKTLTNALVIGSGPYRIGSSVEFDWCSVTAGNTLRKKGIETIIVNCNPETVSTDFDNADKLYFEELTLERIQDISEIENNPSIILAFGGQVPNNLAIPAYNAGLKVLGTSPESIDIAENRERFSGLLDQLQVEQPQWQRLTRITQASKFAQTVGYPVLVRPSYVLSGSAMRVAYSNEELKRYLGDAAKVSGDFPVVISKFILNAKEIEIDGVARDGELLIYAISEHVENAGVHSGDATIVLPPQRIYLETLRQLKHATRKILKALKINGPFNIQFMAKDNNVLVIELNLRASRSFPFVSKVTGYDFAEIATRVMLGEKIEGDFKTLDLDYVGVKFPQFSFNRIKGVDPLLRVEMASTGEVASFGKDISEAFLKAFISTGWNLPQKKIFVSLGGDDNKLEFVQSARNLVDLGLQIFATENTSKLLKKRGIKNTKVFKISEKKNPSILDLMLKGEIDLVINIIEQNESVGKLSDQKDGFTIRRTCADFGIPLITNLQEAITFATALHVYKLEELEISSWDEYTSMKSV